MGAWALLVLAFVAWGGFAYLTQLLGAERVEYADLAAVSAQDGERQETASRLRSVVQSTEVERAALEGVVGIPLVDAAETIEASVRSAGVREIQISGASAQQGASKDISSVSVGVSGVGSFTSLVRAVLLLEQLPLPSMLEQFEIAKNENEWRLNARVRLTLSKIQ